MESPLRTWKFPSQTGTFTCHERQVDIKWWCWCFKFHSVSQEDDKGYSRIDKPKYISQLCALPKLYTFWIHVTKALAYHVGYKSWVHTVLSNGVSHLDTDHKILPLTLSCVNGPKRPSIKRESNLLKAREGIHIQHLWFSLCQSWRACLSVKCSLDF